MQLVKKDHSCFFDSRVVSGNGFQFFICRQLYACSYDIKQHTQDQHSH